MQTSRVPRRTRFLTSVVLFVAVMALLVFYDRPLVRGDAVAYFAYGQSLALDGDLNLCNQADQLGALNSYQIFRVPETGACATAVAFGTGALVSPYLKLAQFLTRFPIVHVNDAYFIQQQGALFISSFLAMLGVNLFVALAVVLAYLAAAHFVSNLPASIAGLALFAGTSLWYYGSVEPLYSHGVGAFAVSLMVYLWVVAESRGNGRSGGWRWLAVGLAAGIAALVRWQLALIAVPVGIALVARRRWSGLVWFCAGLAALTWLVPYTWWSTFGVPFVLPSEQQDSSAILTLPRYVGPVLFSGSRGLFVWAPLSAFALVPGVWFLWRRHRAVGFVAAGIVLLQVLVCSASSVWWAGWSFGMRRLTEIYPVLVLGLAALLQSAIRSLARRGASRALAVIALAAMALGTAYATILLPAHLEYMWTSGHPEGATPWVELRYLAGDSGLHTLAEVMKDHTGPWAWGQPGP